jgi:hypothetical protein
MDRRRLAMKRNRLGILSLLTVIVALSVCSPVAAAGEPMATVETNWEDVTVNLMTVTRKGSVLTVKFSAVNNGSDSRKVAFGFAGNDVCYAVDEESGSKYYVLTDKEGNPVASAKDWMPNSTTGINREIASGKSMRVWMKMPAPPTEVRAISIFLNETDPFENVPITDL